MRSNPRPSPATGELRVAIDDQIFIAQRLGGISRYFAELIKIFRESPELEVEAVTPFRYVMSEHLLERDPLRYSIPPLPAVAQRRKVLRTLNSVQRIVRRPDRAEIVHHTFYYPEYLRRPAAVRVCTIYDMIPERYPGLYPGGNPHVAKDLYVQACDALMCVSNTTKNDLLSHYGPLDKPIVITPLGVGEEFFSARAVSSIEQPYVLFVGQRVGYKNFDVLLRAFSKLIAKRSLKLLCVGGPGFDEVEVTRIATLNLQNQVTHRTVTDDELPALYASAVCFVFPSYYEGFGLPIVEAFAAGCPVVLVEMNSALEVGGNAAQFFDAHDDEKLAEIIETMVDDPASRSHWIDEGRKRAPDFRWYKTAELTRDLYRSVARQHG